VELPPLPVWVEADEIRLTQVVTNLLNNAAKYTEEDGHIVLHLEASGGEAVLRVQDNGIGIALDLLPHVFDLFTQAQRGSDRSQGGLGIGLTLVRRLVELHNGRVEAISDGLGRGSEFIVHLPLMVPPRIASGTKSGSTAAHTAQDSKRILVVDDNKDGAESLSALLRVAGQDVRTEYEGSQALEAAQRFCPEVVILDIGLPGIDGNEVARRLRQLPATSQSLLIALTGYSQDEDRLKVEQAGFDCHFIKPGDVNALLEVIARGRKS